MVIVEPFGGAPADLVEGMGSLAEELDVRVQVKHLHEQKVVGLIVEEDMHSEFVEKFLVL